MIIRSLLRKSHTKSLISLSQHSMFQQKPPPFDKTKDYFLILKVFKDASKEEITKAYQALRKEPNQNHQELSDAFRVLTDDKLKKSYLRERFVYKLDDKLNESMKGNSQETEFEEKPKQEQSRYSHQLSPKERQFLEKNKKYLRLIFVIVIGGALFYPFFTWKTDPELAAKMRESDPSLSQGKRHMGAFMTRTEEQKKQHEEIAKMDQQYPYNPPGVKVVGRFVGGE